MLGRTRRREIGEHPSIDVDQDGDAPVVHLTGEFDFTSRDALKQRLALLNYSKRQAVVVDLTGTTFLDSTIIGVLVAAHRDGLNLTIRGAAGYTRHTLDLLAIPEVFPFED